VSFTVWYLVVGVLLIGMALIGTRLKRWPLTTSLVYLLVGVALGPAGFGLIRLDPVRWSAVLLRVTELAVIVSLFTAGLKLRTPLDDRRWLLPVRLASVSMTVTVALITAVGVLLLGMPVGAAVLLGAVLAPTDPVLASDVQVTHPTDRDRLRFALTGEAGLNDGAAFPFVMLGLGLLGLHELGAFGWRWFAVEVLWAVTCGLAVGAAAGTVVGRLVVHLRRTHKEAVGLDEFLSLGLLALSYGLALLLLGYGFLAAFAAGVALRRVEVLSSSDGRGEERGGGGDDRTDAPPPDVGQAAAVGAADEVATDAEKAPAWMAQAVLGFNEQFERICEVAVVVLLGGMLTADHLTPQALWFVPLLFLIIRPLAVLVGLVGTRKTTALQRGMTCWFGIRGVGSVYYLAYALQHGLVGTSAQQLTALTLTTVAASVVVHGVSVTPLMSLYERWAGRRQQRGRLDGGADAEAAPR
jgi:NhaP-type Na+/H+ or K+/H+ antiporter